MSLTDIAKRHNSDKLTHGYMPFYESWLPDSPHSILEIGVKEGESIKIWKEAYPDAQLIGMDLFQEFPIPAIDGVQWIKANQLDHEALYHIRNDVKPQIIIEDASHCCINHWVTLMSLIPSCRYYFIEDIFTCREEFYRQGLEFEQTVLGAMLLDKFPFEFILSNDEKIAMIYGDKNRF